MSKHGRAVAKVLLIFVLCLAAGGGAASPPVTQPVDDAKQLEAWWADLQKFEPWTSRALLDFYDNPAKTVAFLKDHLKPLKIEQKELDDLLSALGSDDEKVWKPAFEKLSYFDPRLNVDLETLMINAHEQVQRNHLIEVLCDYPADTLKGRTVNLRSTGGDGDFNFYEQHASWWAESKVSRLSPRKRQWQRAERAIILLQHIGSPDAIALLKDIAGGHPDAEPTKVAKVALESLCAAEK